MTIDKQNEDTAGRPVGAVDPQSLTTRLRNLQVGECESKAKRIALTELNQDTLTSGKHNLAKALRTAALRASAQTGYTYKVETGEYLAADALHVIVCAVITRIT